MKRWMMATAVAMSLLPQMVSAQHQPYGGLQARPVKALSEQQIADLRAGRGMGLALAAELNGYPGPLHVMELAVPLALTDAQRERMAQLFEAMKAEAVALGERLIAAEADLDGQFAGKVVTEASLVEGVEAIAAVQAALRTAHLKYHLATVGVLTPQHSPAIATCAATPAGRRNRIGIGESRSLGCTQAAAGSLRPGVLSG